MAYIHLYRGGTPIFKPLFCAGTGAEYTIPFDAEHQPGTPPFDSHADAAHEQGYLNLHFPLVPNLADTRAHAWMQNLLKNVKAVNDVILTNWVPLRSYLDSYYIELVKGDPDLTGVYVTPTAYRCQPDPEDYENPEAITLTEISAFSDELNAACGARRVPLGTPTHGTDKRYLMARLGGLSSTASSSSSSTLSGSDVTTTTTTTVSTDMDLPWSFGHNMVYDNAGTKTAEDAYYGAVVLGLKVTGTANKIPLIATGNFELYISAKCLTFEGSGQIG